ncbi:hypothetical protein SDJN02_02742, partial [Cucurbita argyrosperma subsp. argyrosperma]
MYYGVEWQVLNGIWQSSGGRGRIDCDNRVEAMLRYADAGLSTFDMADQLTKWVPPSVKMTISYVRAVKEQFRLPFHFLLVIHIGYIWDVVTYGTIMGGLLNDSFAGPSLNTPSLQNYKR